LKQRHASLISLLLVVDNSRSLFFIKMLDLTQEMILLVITGARAINDSL